MSGLQDGVDPVRLIEAATGHSHWSTAHQIIRSVSKTRARVAVKGCHASSKTYVAADIILSTILTGGDVITCYAEGTEILTRSGWKRFEDVVVGPDGDQFATRNQRTHAFEWQRATRYYEADYDGDIVELVGRGGTFLRVTPNHRVLLKWSDRERSGEHLKNAGDIPVGTHNGIPVTSAWEGVSPQTVRFGRYEWSSSDFAAFMGAWLAEGSLGGRNVPRAKHGEANGGRGRIVITQLPKTKGYDDYRALLTRMLGREPSVSNGRNFHFNCQELWDYLLPLKTSAEKYIPEEIKNWAADDLATLIRYHWLGDGHVIKVGERVKQPSLRATTVSKRLADDLQEIAQKTGQFATITPRQPRDARIEGRDIPARRQRVSYEIRYCRSTTKRVQPRRAAYRGKVRCVSVPNEIIYVRNPSEGVTIPVWCGNTAPTGDQVKGVLWATLHRAIDDLATGPIGIDTSTWTKNQTEIILPDGHFALGRSTDQGVRFQGYHAQGDAPLLIVVDEAPGVIGAVMEAVEGISAGGDVRLLLLGNPVIPSGPFYEIFASDAPGWTRITIDAFDSPNFAGLDLEDLLAMPLDDGGPLDQNVRPYLITRRWVREKHQEWGESHPAWHSRVRGRFPTQATDSLFPLGWLEQSQRRRAAYSKGVPMTAGIDVAGEGEDETVVYIVQGDDIIALGVFTEPDPRGGVAALLMQYVRYGLALVNVDKAGLGLYFQRHLEDILPDKVRVRGINVGEKPIEDPADIDQETGRPRVVSAMFVNYKAQLYWLLRERFREARVNGLVDQTTLAQLAGIRYYQDNRGRTAIESKRDARRRGVSSPDRAEALMLAYAPEPGQDPRTALYGKSFSETVGGQMIAAPSPSAWAGMYGRSIGTDSEW